MRMMALGQAWRARGGEVHFCSAEIPDALADRLAAERFHLSRIEAAPGSAGDLAATLEMSSARGSGLCGVVALDGYQFGADFQSVLQEAGRKTLLLDDYGHSPSYHSRWVLNQNVSAHAGLYRDREPSTRLLLGTKFALLRTEFLEHRPRRRVLASRAQNVLVTLGGTDPGNATSKVMKALAGAGYNCKVVCGASNPHRLSLLEAAEDVRGQPGKFEVLVAPENMPELLSWADVAIVAGGSTVWEACFFGVPCLVGTLADNQREVAKGLADRGAARIIGDLADVDASVIREMFDGLAHNREAREELQRKARALVDGLGSRRVVANVQADLVQIRPAESSDRELLWHWTNDPGARSASFRPEFVPWDDHVAWFTDRLQAADCAIFLCADPHGDPLGVVRFETLDYSPTVSISVAPEARGGGWGAAMLIKCSEAVARERLSCSTLHAYIRPTNPASLRAFDLAGFEKVGNAEVAGQPAEHWTQNLN